MAQLHQLQGLLHFSLNSFAFQIEDLRRYEQFLSLHSTLGYHCLYGVSEGNFVVVHSRSIDVAAGAQLQSLSQQIGNVFLIAEFVCAEALQLKDLFVG